MSSEQLDLISETIHLPGNAVASFTPRGLVFSEEASEEDILKIGHRLFAVRGYVKWSLGSLFAEMLRKRQNPDARNHPNDFDSSWLTEFCSAHQLDPKERREMLGVFTFYQGCNGTPPLSFEHHREAMWGAANGKSGALDRAIGYLNLAFNKGLSVTELRATIRSSEKTTVDETNELQELTALSWVYDMRRFVAAEIEKVQSYTPERAHFILVDLGEDTLTYLDAIRALARQYIPTTETLPRTVSGPVKVKATA